MRLATKQIEKQGLQGLHHKSVELWFHIIIWCHPQMVSLGAGRPPSNTTDSWVLYLGSALELSSLLVYISDGVLETGLGSRDCLKTHF